MNLYTRRISEFVGKLLGVCERVLTNCSAVCIFLIMCLTTLDASGRYLFNTPITGAYEFTEQYLQVAAAFLGLGYAYGKGGFIRVTALVDYLPQVKLSVEYFVLIFSILSDALLIVATYKQFLRMFASGLTIGVMNLPVWPAYLIIPVGLSFVCLEMLLDLGRVRAGKASLFETESPIKQSN